MVLADARVACSIWKRIWISCCHYLSERKFESTDDAAERKLLEKLDRFNEHIRNFRLLELFVVQIQTVEDTQYVSRLKHSVDSLIDGEIENLLAFE